MVSFCTATVCSRTLALLGLGGALLALGLAAREQPALSASSNYGRHDLDRDGLTDLQERVIGTMPYRADTDADGYSDLEERGRGSDPLNVVSVPEPAELSIGSCASQEDGFVSVLSVLYVDGAQLDHVALDFGFVFRGKNVRLSPTAQTYTRAFVYRAADPGDTLAVIEIGLPESTVRRLGQVSMWSRIRDTSSSASDPIVTVQTLVNFSGVIMAVEPTIARVSDTGGGPTGVVYRPLVPDDQIPSTWNGGEMCFQRTSAVGMSGVSVVHEVDSAECIPMDTYCSPGDCAAGVGMPLTLPDPAALAGG